MLRLLKFKPARPALLHSLFHLTAIAGVSADPVFIENNGLVVIEAESVTVSPPWLVETSFAGYLGAGHLRGGQDNFNTPGVGTTRYTFRVQSAGRYQISWRNAIGAGTSTTDNNDSFVRLTNASGVPLGPVSNSNTSTGTLWFKLYTNTIAWSYNSSNRDHDPKSLSWDLAAGETYAFEVSSRSQNHLVDRIVLWNHAFHNFADKNTGRASGTSALDALAESAREGGGGGGGGTPTTINLAATTDFPDLFEGEVPYYVDSARGALAIDSGIPEYQDKFARAGTVFTGAGGIYDVTITTLTERDGECTYRLYVNDRLVATYINPQVDSSRDLAPNAHTWTDIAIASGDRIAVSSNTNSNGLYTTVDGVDWSRGRWQRLSLELVAEANSREIFNYRYFNMAERADPVVSGDLADPDFDRLVNGAEYILGLDPRSPDTAAMQVFPPAVPGLPDLGFAVLQDLAPGYSLELQYADALPLPFWTPLDLSSLAATDDGAGRREYRFPMDAESGGEQRFWRLQFTFPD